MLQRICSHTLHCSRRLWKNPIDAETRGESLLWGSELHNLRMLKQAVQQGRSE